MSRRSVFPSPLSEPPMRRRAFLRSLSGAAAAVGLPALLAACGGGGDSGTGGAPAGDGSGNGNGNGGNGGGNGGGPVGGSGAPDTAARMAVLGNVEQQCRTLGGQGLAPLAYVEAVANHLRTLPAYVQVGVDEPTLTAWGVFADGRIHLIANNMRPQRKAAGATVSHVAAQATPTEVPGAAMARVWQPFGPEFDMADTVSALQDTLRQTGWSIRPGESNRAHIEALREVRGDGYFYINTHGGAFQPTIVDGVKTPMYSIQSSTFVSPTWEDEPRMRADLDQRRITYFTASNGDTILGIPQFDTRYGITANFVSAYWSFAADSVVIVNACSSARVDEAGWSAGFVAACHDAGAAVYLGWTDTVTPPAAYRATRWFTDRLLGANAFEPEKTPQRAFAWDTVMSDMHRKKVDLDPAPDSKAVFIALPKPGSTTLQQLAPSIHHVEPDEYRDELRLYGRFGSTRGEVFVDGSARTIVDWTPEKIVVDLPQTGAGSKGAVQVKVRGLRSNLRQLTEWTMALDYAYIPLEAQGLKVAGLGRIRLRADLGKTREAAGEEPTAPVRNAIATRDSNLPLVASGSFPAGQCTLVWSGSAVYPAIKPAGTPRELTAYLQADTAKKAASLGLAIGAANPDFLQSGCGPSTNFQAIFGALMDEGVFPSPVDSTVTIPLHALQLTFDDGWAIGPGFFESVMVRLRWQVAVANHPPLATDAV